MTNQKIMIIGLIAIALIFILGGLFIKRIFFYHYIQETTLVNDFVITSDWKEIGNPDLLKTEKEIQYISILLNPPFEADTPSGGIKTPEGLIINPEVRLVDFEGKEFQLVFGGSDHSGYKNFVNYRYNNGRLPAGKQYLKIMIRSEVQIPVKQILWSGYDAKDLP